MIVKRLAVKNWRNFRRFDVAFRERQFIVGPNAAGKSNLLDVFRFLRDIAKTDGGGLQKAIKDRGGVPKLRSLSARKDPEIGIEFELAESADSETLWRYSLGIRQNRAKAPFVSYERAWRGKHEILNRPNQADKIDPDRLTQTFLEQINANSKFREIARFLQSITYLHLVPQLLRYADQLQGKVIEEDPFGQSFLERVARASEKTRVSRLRVVEQALKIAVPQLQQLKFTRDAATGRPHLQALYSHWRPNAGWQQEDQFSDGTLRLIGLLWSLLEGDAVLLLEEPELSLNGAIVAQIAPLIARLQKKSRRQVILTTHSFQLLEDPGIDGREVTMLTPVAEGTDVAIASDVDDLLRLLEAGFTAADAVLPRTKPIQVGQLSLLQEQ